MNWLFVAAIELIAVLTLTSCVSKDRSNSVVESRSKNGITTLRTYREKQLANGLRLIFLPDASLPALNMSLLLLSGSASDPEGMAGLSNLVSELLDQGTKTRSASAVADDLGQIGASFDSSVSYDFSSVTVSGLAPTASELLKNLVEIVTEPSFAEIEVTRSKQQILAKIERSLDNPRVIAKLTADSLLYGTHVYGRPVVGRMQQVGGLSKKSIIQHYLRYYRPNNAILAVTGKFDSEFEQQVEKAFGAWEKREVPSVAISTPPAALDAKGPVNGPVIRVVEKAGLTQAQIRFVGLGIRRQDRDFLALRVANTILGGSFASRLNDRIRKDLGLTYTINSSFDARLERGPFEIETFTKVESIEKLVTETLALFGEFVTKGVTQEELNRARGYLKGVFPQAIETSEKLAFNLLLLRRYGISDRYLTHYIADLDDLSVADVNAAIRRNFNSKDLSSSLSISIHAPKGAADSLKPMASVFESVSLDSVR